MSTARIGITLGDINGIGPEVALKAARRRWSAGVELVFIGATASVAEQARRLDLPVPAHVDDPGHPAPPWQPGQVTAEAGAAAAAWITHGVRLCQQGRLDALVTAPISKEALHRGGVDFPGHTEMLAQLTGTSRFAMMLYGGPLRVVLATRHIALAAVPRALTAPVIREAITLTAEALPWLGARDPRIAVCGLNPHAGEGGAMGREEIEVIGPVVRELQAAGLPLEGPLPADTVFHRAAQGEFAAVVAMYHDQGLGPLKLVAFNEGVNVTLGLPLVRTSPDHGTAFGIAGRNVANPASMTEAITQAYFLSQRPNPWKNGRMDGGTAGRGDART